jgi:hypothetical protein
LKLTTTEALNLTLAISGIIVSTAGFAITLLQVRKTRSRLEAANQATAHALHDISLKLTIAEIADMRGALKGMQTALRGGRYEAALIQIQGLLEQLHGLRSRPGFQTPDHHTAIQAMVVQLAKLRNKLEAKIALPATELSTPKANNMLSELGTQLSSWAEQLRFNPERVGE